MPNSGAAKCFGAVRRNGVSAHNGEGTIEERVRARCAGENAGSLAEGGKARRLWKCSEVLGAK